MTRVQIVASTLFATLGLVVGTVALRLPDVAHAIAIGELAGDPGSDLQQAAITPSAGADTPGSRTAARR